MADRRKGFPPDEGGTPTYSRFISADQLDDVLKTSRETDATVPETLVRLGLATEEDVAESLSRQFGVPTIDLTDLEYDADAIRILDPDVARKYNIVPVFKLGRTLTVAVADPTNVAALDEIRSLTGCRIEIAVAPNVQIKRLIDDVYGCTEPHRPSRSDEFRHGLLLKLRKARRNRVELSTEPGRTPEGRFLPSSALAADIIAAARRSAIEDLPESEEHEVREVRFKELIGEVRRTISETLDRTLHVEAHVASAHGRHRATVARRNGRFTDDVAAALAQELTLNVYEASSILIELHAELRATLSTAPIKYEWGTLRSTVEGIVITTEPAAQPPARTSSPSILYRDPSEL